MPKVSVIIPVYNAENYIERCLNSVCNQTLKDIEIICVDDCSTDNSLEILNNYAARYPTMKIIHHEVNGGESRARNTGLAVATGEYIGFVDNDDEIDLDFYEKLYNKAVEDNADIVKGEVHRIEYDGKESYSCNNGKVRINKFYFAVDWWTALYNIKLIKDNNIVFLDGYPLGTDVLFVNEVVIRAKKVSTVDDAYYHYYRRKDSGDSIILSIEKVKSSLKIFEIIMNNLNHHQIMDINPQGYDYVYYLWFEDTFKRSFRNTQKECKSLCAHNLINFFYLCKRQQQLGDKFFFKYPCVKDFILMNDVDGFIQFFVQNCTEEKMLFSNLRYNIVNRKNNK